MDIQKWLDEAAVSSHQGQLNESPNRARNGPHVSGNASRKKQKRKRSRTDSSLLEVAGHHRSVVATQARSHLVNDTSDLTSGSESIGTRSESSKSGSLNEVFTKQPRRKTRPERYETSMKTTKEQRKYVHRSKRKESGKSRSKTRRQKSDNLGRSTAYSFKAQNITGDRLTVRETTDAVA